MSISGALANALTGLTAAARAAEVVSSNISNAMTEGYGRRDVVLSSQNLGSSGGVRVVGISRHVNSGTLAELRAASSALAQEEAANAFWSRLETVLGAPGEAGSLSTGLADLESALVSAAAMPGSDTRLSTVATQAAALADTFNTASDNVQSMREEADRSISSMVDRLNTLLGQVETLNKEMSSAINQGRDTAALEDDRQLVIDERTKRVAQKVTEFLKESGDRFQKTIIFCGMRLLSLLRMTAIGVWQFLCFRKLRCG